MKRWVMNLKESIYKRDIYEGLEGRKGREKYCKYVIISKGSKRRKKWYLLFFFRLVGKE